MRDTEQFILLARRADYTTDDWPAGARHLQTDFHQHMKLTREFFERTVEHYESISFKV